MALSFIKIPLGVGTPANPVPESGGVMSWLIQLTNTGNSEVGSISKDVEFTITDLISSIVPNADIISASWDTNFIVNQGETFVPGPASGTGDVNFSHTGPISTDNTGNWVFQLRLNVVVGPSDPLNGTTLPGLQLSTNTASVNVVDGGYGDTLVEDDEGFMFQAVRIEIGEICCGLEVLDTWEHEEYGVNSGRGYGQSWTTCVPPGVNDWTPLGP